MSAYWIKTRVGYLFKYRLEQDIVRCWAFLGWLNDENDRIAVLCVGFMTTKSDAVTVSQRHLL